ncbi:fused MFS/spermidine synthase [Bosea sp. (in: a-proteobacteria)]|uniref:spermidine synthase n=1 Tax=Bosea sp. (in: a-proteobacteria) TaxID=1871050 RepID=UPI001AC30C39|nr:fused MFS/spermidine synthase [Bosea sp. (in: a-proteobacteria)]MBN9435808.1 fused MFS/spermidine synthase [Bosea sp. (in: a-proteobacteria)]
MSSRAIAALYGATMGLAGFLLFQVQPVMAKYILPWFGGSAATWIVCMLFFQLALLAGYAYVYVVTRPLSLAWQVLLQITLLAAVLLLLPITPSDGWKPMASGDPTWRIILLLAASVGAPYALLATTSPMLQRWLAQLPGQIEVSRLFAVSNFGSFLGLLSYPFIFERTLSSQEQTWLWSIMFAVYAALLGLCAWAAWRAASRATPVAGSDAASRQRRGGPPSLWIVYSTLGSVLLLATTNQITQWSAVIPFLWIAPLSLYLLTFVIAFGQQRHYPRTVYAIAFLLFAGLSFLLPTPDSASSLAVAVIVQCLTMFTGCMICHAEMVRLQPEPSRLPAFYLATAVGGAIGGLLVALLAPLLLPDYWEQTLAIVLIAAFALRPEIRRIRERWQARHVGIAAAAALFLVALSVQVLSEITLSRDLVARVRNFYGVVKVLREDGEAPEDASLVMQQAGVDQGSQFLAADRRTEPACAFTAGSGVGQAIFRNATRRANPDAPVRIGIVGLGAGMLAALGRPGDIIRYYELNPAVKDLVDRHFSFVRDSQAKVEIVLGDGRLLLEREVEGGRSQNYDVIVMNAFRGASPPMHLMTKEAFDIYLRHLKPDGVLAINFELDTLEVAPLHRGLAAASGLDVSWVETASENGCEDPISWALYTRDKGFWEVPEVKAAMSPWRDGSQSRLLWTDRNSNLMSIVPW